MSLLKFADNEEQCALFKELKQEDIRILGEWQRKQPHLPSPLHPIETTLFLHRCGFFSKRHPNDPQVQLALDTSLITILPDLTPEKYLVFYVWIMDKDPQSYNFNALIKTADMFIDLVQKQLGYHNGYIGIIDLKGLTISHFFATNIISVRKVLGYMQKMLPGWVKSFHFVNGVPFMDKIMGLVQLFVNKDLPLKVHYGDNSMIFEFVPQDILPIECGGSRFNATEYYKNVMRKNLERHVDYFKMTEMQVVDESKRPGKFMDFEDVMGIAGTFNKLNVD